MDCLSSEALQDLVSGEIPQAARNEALQHLRQCERCRRELRVLIELQSALMELTEPEPCPSNEEVDEYVAGSAAKDVANRVSAHIEDCEACRSYVELLRASEAEVSRSTEQEERIFIAAHAEEKAEVAARTALERLLPEHLGLFEKLWSKAAEVFSDLSAKETSEWPSFRTGQQFAGAIGFIGTPGPEITSGIIIVMTALAVALELESGACEKSQAGVRRRAGELAKQFGAGSELQREVSSALPPLLTA